MSARSLCLFSPLCLRRVCLLKSIDDNFIHSRRPDNSSLCCRTNNSKDMGNLHVRDQGRQTSTSHKSATTSGSEPHCSPEETTTSTRERTIIPQLKRLKWEDFEEVKSDTQIYAIDVLVRPKKTVQQEPPYHCGVVPIKIRINCDRLVDMLQEITERHMRTLLVILRPM
ncbi:hypothetical protein CC86DRAFT_211983 [Ophiobolus disseminans]|uniref:Uncharacterized protein n=1 Tax=Ophiobolus disseminans TaxID=1469910 RepID=A0A6A7A3V5_9PLEO|nr:hypothetical protein CC86DRAFT_211983 [Ophiobolus disseminans]